MSFSDLTPENTIEGGTDGTIIGNLGDRLKVDAAFSQNPQVPAEVLHHTIVFLATSGGSNVMSINGSVTPVEFFAGPGAGKVWYVDSIGFEFSDSGASKAADWAAINLGLTNGFLIESTINSVDRTIVNLKTNRGVVTSFHSGAFSGGASGFITDSNFYSGILNLDPNMTLIGDDGDMIKATVRDDLTGLVSQQMIIHYWEVI